MLRAIAAAVLGLVLVRVSGDTPQTQAARLRAGAARVEIVAAALGLMRRAGAVTERARRQGTMSCTVR